MYDDENDPDPEVTASEGNTEGNVTVSTRRGYAFVSSNTDIPKIDFKGVDVTAEQADFLVEESNGLVRINIQDKE